MFRLTLYYQYYFEFFVDGNSVHRVENKNPRQFENVTVWAATTRSNQGLAIAPSRKGSIADANFRHLQCHEKYNGILTGCNGIPVKGDIFTPKYK